MSISSEITRITGNIASAYEKVSGKGGTLPAAKNSANLPAAIESIPSGGGKGGDYNIVQTIDGDNCSLAITDANTFTVVPKTVTANGTYVASADNADGYSQVTVDVSGGGGETCILTITNNADPRYYDFDFYSYPNGVASETLNELPQGETTIVLHQHSYIFIRSSARFDNFNMLLDECFVSSMRNALGNAWIPICIADGATSASITIEEK